MSRVGKKPVSIPKGVNVQFVDNTLKVKGPKGELTQWIDPTVNVNIENDEIVMTIDVESRKNRALHGLYRNLASNMTVGVSDGFEKALELIGVGYDAEIRHDGLYLELGLSHAVYLKPPQGVTIVVEKPKGKMEAAGTANQYLIAKIVVSGIDKELVGQVAAKIREQRIPDVYKSKGIRYFGERIQLKPGKTGAA